MISALASITLAALLLVTAAPAGAASHEKKAQAEAATKAAAAKSATSSQRRFVTADEATKALVAAARANDRKAMLAILGPGSAALISSGDPIADQQSRERFLKGYESGNKLVASGAKTVLHTGPDEWPFPIPLVKEGELWRFDAQQGRDEILARAIGRNEIYAINTCLAYVDAQREYYGKDRNGNNVLEYAQKFASSPGKMDGLYWPTKAGEPPSPLGALVARARSEGYRKKGDGPTPYHGYYYKILTAQGPAAAGGASDYLVKGMMIGGFALVAVPAQYGVSGVMSFLVNHDGIVYEKDLGPDTHATARAMKAFNPDETWKKSEVPALSSASR